MFNAELFLNTIILMSNGGYTREQIRDRIKQEIENTKHITGLRYERLSGDDNANVSKPIVERPYNVIEVIQYLGRLHEILEQFGGEIKTFRGSVYIEPNTTVSIPFRSNVPSSLTRCKYEWGYSEGESVVFTGKLTDLAYTLKRYVFTDCTSNKQIREEVESCSAIQFNGSIAELYTKLTYVRGRKKDHKDGPALATLLKTVLRK